MKRCLERQNLKMKALVHSKAFEMVYKDIPKPTLESDSAIVKIKSVGICGSDIHGYTGDSGRRIPPIVMGHEASGEIVEVNSNSKYKVGQKVTFDSTIYCGNCDYCDKGLVNLCSNRKVLGVSCDEYTKDGAMAEYLLIPERIIYSLNDNIDMDDAALIEPASVAYHSISISEIKTTDNVLVIGAGVIGLIIIQALRIKGCNNIIVADKNENRLKIAKYYGANTTVNTKEKDITNRLINDYKNTIDIIFEAVGISETIGIGIEVVKKKGKVILIGNISPFVQMPLQKIVTKEINMIGSCAIKDEYTTVIKHLSEKKLQFDKIITAKAPLSEGDKYFKIIEEGSSDHIKVILNP